MFRSQQHFDSPGGGERGKSDRWILTCSARPHPFPTYYAVYVRCSASKRFERRQAPPWSAGVAARFAVNPGWRAPLPPRSTGAAGASLRRVLEGLFVEQGSLGREEARVEVRRRRFDGRRRGAAAAAAMAWLATPTTQHPQIDQQPLRQPKPRTDASRPTGELPWMNRGEPTQCSPGRGSSVGHDTHATRRRNAAICIITAHLCLLDTA